MVSFIIFVLMDKRTIWITYAWMRTVSKSAENIPAFNTKFMHFYFEFCCYYYLFIPLVVGEENTGNIDTGE